MIEILILVIYHFNNYRLPLFNTCTGVRKTKSHDLETYVVYWICQGHRPLRGFQLKDADDRLGYME